MATIKIIQKQKPLSNGLYPIFLRIIKDRKTKLISLNIACDKENWNENKSVFRKNFPNYIQYNNSITNIKSRAEKIVSDFLSTGEDFTLKEFEEQFFNFKHDKKITVADFWEQHITELIESNRIGNSKYYRETMKSFFNVFDGDLFFKDITPNVLSTYEVYLRGRNNSENGISARMRAIRSIYNKAIAKGFASQENYPFKAYKVSKLKSAVNKRALSIKDVQKIKDFDTSQHPKLVDAKNYFLFSYFTRGMNFYDMMNLTWDDIIEDKIVYVRRKTGGRLRIKILEPVQQILDHYKSQNRSTKYVFPILLKDGLSALQIEYRKEKTIQIYNKQLKEIGNLCNINGTITSYVARHSFATNLKQKGVSTDIISEAMGHQNIAVTQAYLKELEDEVIDDAMSNLL